MTDFTKRIIFIVLYWISETRLISALEHYCEWGLCKEEEDCCGPNKCCPKRNITDTFYIIAWILAGLLVIAISCGSLLRQRKNSCRFFKYRSEKNLLIEQPD